METSAIALLVVVAVLVPVLCVVIVYWLRARVKSADESNENLLTSGIISQQSNVKNNTSVVSYEELEFGKLLGKGSQGEVFRAIFRGTEVFIIVVNGVV